MKVMTRLTQSLAHRHKAATPCAIDHPLSLSPQLAHYDVTDNNVSSAQSGTRCQLTLVTQSAIHYLVLMLEPTARSGILG
jgi:hypothetical protein